MESPETPVHLDKVEARSGATPHIARYVLVISLALAIVALAAVWMTGAINAPDDTGGTADTAQAVQEQAQKDAAK
ncbi:hypothetical protein WSK_2435 [Novosphingobium sp. Rr 2-17]|uniref:hypothetical protein n=1 Tax=Novosphingobium sp. Rr 2-17 TaxID=555793 RepID=UPI000269A82F|nr:hypothetical protein [Novosphingobium sp. Rr 2-17]EIZ78892.1 hypothetical protein WSK_2435 [Novosphingobium sp. Rr 2-17]